MQDESGRGMAAIISLSGEGKRGWEQDGEVRGEVSNREGGTGTNELSTRATFRESSRWGGPPVAIDPTPPPLDCVHCEVANWERLLIERLLIERLANPGEVEQFRVQQ